MSITAIHDNPDKQSAAHRYLENGVLWELLTPLRPYLRDDSLTEICINRPGEVWTEGRDGWRKYPLAMDLAACERLAIAIAGFNHQHFNALQPIVSASLPKGERIQMVMPPACQAGAISLTIRRHSTANKTLDELEDEGSFSQCRTVGMEIQPFERELLTLYRDGFIREFLERAVKSHRNILIAGKTGSGKTTIAKSLISCISPGERLITIEDVHELFLSGHPNRVHLFYSRNAGGISAKEALASCLRMKPDRILLAELRGDEAWEFVKSINTGHPGAISTLHANGATDAFEQMTAFVKDSPTGSHLDVDYIQRRLFETVDVVLFYHKRRLKEVYYDPEKKRQ